MNAHFFQSLTVNSDSKALIRFLKAIMYNAKGGPSGSHHNILSLQFWFLKMFRSFVIIKLLRGSFTIAIKRFISHNKWLCDQQMDHSDFADSASKHLKLSNFLTSTEFMWYIFIDFPHVANFSWGGSIFLKSWYPLSETFPRHMGLVRLVFSDMDCQL